MAKNKTRSISEIRADLARNRAQMAESVSELVEEVNPKNVAQRTVDTAKDFAAAEFEAAKATVKDENGWRTDRLMVIGGAVLGVIAFVVTVKSISKARNRSLGDKARDAIDKKFEGGRPDTSTRPCSKSVSEHEDGRAIDWTMDAAKAADRAEVDRFLAKIFATDADGQPHALARRMGIMYVIWNDSMYRAYGNPRFAKDPYLSSSCPRRKTCSKTLRHRDHVHLSLGKPGGRAETTWYDRVTS